MSTATARTRVPRTSETAVAQRPPRRAPTRVLEPPRIDVVAQPAPPLQHQQERVGRGLFTGIVVALLVAGLLMLLVINTSMAQGAFRVQDLQQAKAKLSESEAMLSESVSAAAAPVALEGRARAMGMIPTERPVFLTVPDGKVLGKPRLAGTKKRPAGSAAVDARPKPSAPAEVPAQASAPKPRPDVPLDAAPDPGTTR